jgi:7-cyano-7-deazaguanine tRNA-ribosyltransferase
LLPVVNPAIQPVPPRQILEDFKCKAIIANAYLIKKRFGEDGVKQGIHRLLDFQGIVATDSGAYQILRYGKIDLDPVEIARYQESIGSDIAVILDIPTGMDATRESAESTVKETLARADQTLSSLTRTDILWVGPIQGGTYLDLVAFSAQEMSRRAFPILALGSPTQLMQRYEFEILVDMIVTAKSNIPSSRPLHLFGAGHPAMLALAVALGCDLFDSAAYALFARRGRYMTSMGTLAFSEIDYFPCTCPSCVSFNPAQVKKWRREEQEAFLASHNLYVSLEEVRRIRQAIREGRLWELLEARSRSHPAMRKALLKLSKYEELLEKGSPVTKPRGILFFDSSGLSRPEIVRHGKRILERYRRPQAAQMALLIPSILANVSRINGHLSLEDLNVNRRVHICLYSIPYGPVPLELHGVFPLSQTEISLPPDNETVEHVSSSLRRYLLTARYKRVVIAYFVDDWTRHVATKLKRGLRETTVTLSAISLGSMENRRIALERLGSLIKTAAYSKENPL